MEQKFLDYIRKSDILGEQLNIDFSDLAFAYDYNEVQELYFDKTQNNYVFLAGETGLRKKDMLGRICQDLISSGIEKEDILYLDYELPILHNEQISDIVRELYIPRKESKNVFLVINEIQECGDWFAFVKKLREEIPRIKLLCSSSTPPYVFERIYDENCDFCKIVVLSQKNASNIKYETQSFGVYQEFKYNQKNGFIEIKGLTKEGKKMPYHSVPSEINGYPVKIIASGAFHDRHEIQSIILPDSIEMIGDYAFSKCDSLREITLPKSLEFIGEHAFLGAKSLERIIGGERVAHIGNSAFYRTKWLENQLEFAILGSTLYKYKGSKKIVEIPQRIGFLSSYAFADSTVESISSKTSLELGEGAFYNCQNLKFVDIKMHTIPPFAFYNCKSLTDNFEVESVGKFGIHGCLSITGISAKELGICALENCKDLVSVKNALNVAQGALWGCYGLCEIDTADLKTIGAFAFGKTALKIVEVKGGEIGDYAFCLSKDLHSVKIASSTSIGRSVLYKCNSIKEMEIDGGKKLSYYFAGEIPQIETLTVHGDITDDFCRNNPYLKTLNLQDVQQFGRWSFYNNSSLHTITLKNVIQIGDWAFAYCDGLKQIELPKETEYIGMNAFRYCHNLSEIKILSNSVVMFGANAFYSTADNKMFYVPSVLLNDYQSIILWNDYRKNLKKL